MLANPSNDCEELRVGREGDPFSGADTELGAGDDCTVEKEGKEEDGGREEVPEKDEVDEEERETDGSADDEPAIQLQNFFLILRAANICP